MKRIKKGNIEEVTFGQFAECPMPGQSGEFPLPPLTAVQCDSYAKFLQQDKMPEERKPEGLQLLFTKAFPIISNNKKLEMHFVHYSFGAPKYTIDECKRRGKTYEVPIKAMLRVKGKLSTEEVVKEQNVNLGMIPMMTDNGTFIINGVERVIVSQLQRSPGIYYKGFSQEDFANAKNKDVVKKLFWFTLIPNRGTWLEAVCYQTNDIYISVDRRHPRRRVRATTLLRALGYERDEDLLDLFYKVGDRKISETNNANLKGLYLGQKLTVGNVTLEKATELTEEILENLLKAGVKSVKVYDAPAGSPILHMIDEENWEYSSRKSSGKNDVSDNRRKEALREIYHRFQPGEPFSQEQAEKVLRRLFFEPASYDLSDVGRYKFNEKLGLPITEEEMKRTTLNEQDIVEALSYLLDLVANKEKSTKHPEIDVKTDDIDHLGNRRIRPVGELVANQCRIALARMDRYIKDRMTNQTASQQQEIPQPEKLINPRILSNLMRDFFGRSQLSQFMDQLNPLAELTHKRRLSALGPGGLNRDRAGLQVRDVHNSHYGRICPIETPEGANIGLIASMSTYMKTNKYGFMETPYLKVENCKVTDKVVYLPAHEEEKYTIAQANALRDKNGKFVLKEGIKARKNGDFKEVKAKEIEYIDVSPKQIVSIAAGLIPFLEHDDANRALMGSNMQRQAVPLLTTEAPMVRTGLEEVVAKESGAVLTAKIDGVVKESDATHIVIEGKNGKVQNVELLKFKRSNAGTTINYHPYVKSGAKVKAGDVIANGPATADGVLSLGRNILCAYMPWEGYNFEDAIVISERALKEDFYTSVHIESFDCIVAQTKLGAEETTRDIPNVGAEALSRLDSEGIVIPGTEVKPGDILVGKITPKSETELSPEERLLKAIFGDKAADVRDASLKVPAGTYGVVMHVDVFRQKSKDAQRDKAQEKKLQKEATDRRAKQEEEIQEWYRTELDKICSEKLKGAIIDEQTGDILADKGQTVPPDVKSIIRTKKSLVGFDVEDKEFASRVNRLHYQLDYKKEELAAQYAREIDTIKRGDDMDSHMLKMVRVYIAIKQKLQVGDKMAGRHGNKGIVAKILAEEDMPFMEDGTPVDIVLNPLGVPSRMNVGQIMEAHLGWVCRMLGLVATTPVFDGATEKDIEGLLNEAKAQAEKNDKKKDAHLCATSLEPKLGKVTLYDGRTGEAMYQKVTVGYTYFMKLGHLVANKIHARATGPYSLVTQQPLGGKAQSGGQRFGEMEVWALEAYGAAYTLQEMLTVKSDDTEGRKKTYESITKGNCALEASTPESFNVLVKELRAACLDIRTEKK